MFFISFIRTSSSNSFFHTSSQLPFLLLLHLSVSPLPLDFISLIFSSYFSLPNLSPFSFFPLSFFGHPVLLFFCLPILSRRHFSFSFILLLSPKLFCPIFSTFPFFLLYILHFLPHILSFLFYDVLSLPSPVSFFTPFLFVAIHPSLLLLLLTSLFFIMSFPSMI